MEDLFLQRVAISQEDYIKTSDTYWQGLKDKDAKPYYQDKSTSELVDLTGITLDTKIDQYRTHLMERGYTVSFYKDNLLKRRVTVHDGITTADIGYVLPVKTATST